MDFLVKIENAIEFLEDEKVQEIEVPLTYAELKEIRKNILIEKYSTDLSAENLRTGLKFGKSLRR